MTLRHCLILGGVFAAAAAIGLWSHRHEVSQRRAELHDEQASDAAVLAALERPVAMNRQTVTLEQFAQQVERAAGVRVVVDADELDAHPIWMSEYNGLGERSARAIPLYLPRATIPAFTALRLVLAQSEIDYAVTGGQVLITLPDVVGRQSLHVVVYPLPQPHFTGSEYAEDYDWYDAITTLIRPDSWADVGGVGHCQAVPGALIIAHQPRVHAEISQLLEQLSRLENPPASWEPVPLVPIGDSSRLAVMLRKLRGPGQLDCREMPLDELAEYLSDVHELPIVLDVRRLNDVGIKASTPITRTLSGVSLHSLLATALADLDLTYVIEDGLIEITTPDDADDRLWTVAYPVHDLVATETGPDYTPLIDLITSTITPDSWDDVGGPGHCGEILGGWLIVSQTHPIHEQIEQLMAQLRRGLSHEEHRPVLAVSAFPETDERILAALEREMPLELVSTRLEQLCRHLTEATGVCVQLDKKSLGDNGINIDAPLTCSFPKAPLRVQLTRLCEALEMDFAIRAESLLLTTPDMTDCSLHTRLYDVRPLIDPDLGLGDETWLIDTVTAHVTPDSWDDVGGPGSIVCYRGLLVVINTIEIQRELAGLLKVAGTWSVAGLPACHGRQECLRHTRSVPATLDAGDDALFDRLAEPVPVELSGMPADAAVKALNQKMTLPLRLDHAALARAGRWPLDEPVAFSTKGLPLGVVLDRMLPDDLGFYVKSRELLVSSAERRESTVHTRLFDARRLAAALNLSDEWLEVEISAHVAPDSWDDVGGRGAPSARRGLLFVTQTHEVQRQVEALLVALGDVADTRSVPTTLNPADETAFRSLSGIVEADLNGLPIDYACERLSDLSGVPIWIDVRGIPGLEVFPAQSVSILPAAKSLDNMLEEMLPAGLGYYVQGGQIVITAAEEVELRLFTRLYRVRDGAAAALCDQLLSGVPSHEIAADYWTMAGGVGEATSLGDSWIVVTADAARHQRIERWLGTTGKQQFSHRGTEAQSRQ